jgi:phosphate uptake regulator
MMWRKLIQLWKSDNLLQQAWQESFEILNLTNQMFIDAVRSLRKKESKGTRKEIWKKDRMINQFQQETRRRVLIHLSTLPSPAELPAGMVLISIVIDIERLGDYMKNIIQLAGYRSDPLNGFQHEKKLKRIEEAVQDMFSRTKTCIESSEGSMGLELLKEYDWVNRLCDQIIKRIVKEKDESIPQGDAASLVIYVRWLKRMNSHLRNIVTSVVNPFDRIGYIPEEMIE